LSAGEVAARREDFPVWAFAADAPTATPTPVTEADVVERIARGGFPEPALGSARFRERWFGAYITTVVQRAIRDLANITGLDELPRLSTLLAAPPHPS
jgi:uncharacterized protein